LLTLCSAAGGILTIVGSGYREWLSGVVGAVKEPAAKTQDASTAQVPYEQQSSTRGIVGVAGYK